jgi:hypothetical protein
LQTAQVYFIPNCGNGKTESWAGCTSVQGQACVPAFGVWCCPHPQPRPHARAGVWGGRKAPAPNPHRRASPSRRSGKGAGGMGLIPVQNAGRWLAPRMNYTPWARVQRLLYGCRRLTAIGRAGWARRLAHAGHSEYPKARAGLCPLKKLATRGGSRVLSYARSRARPQTVSDRAGRGACSPVRSRWP